MIRKKPFLLSALSILLLWPWAVQTAPAQEGARYRFKAEKISGQVYMIGGGYSNVGVLVYSDGLFLIDTKGPPLSAGIQPALDEITDKPVRFVVNTHWHFDHVGGNDLMRKAGAMIIAHEKVRERMSTEQNMTFLNRIEPPSKPEFLPHITFTGDLTFHLDDETVHVIHLQPGHTDGDSIVHFKKANVIHVGDLYFCGMYPYIGITSGGSITFMIEALTKVLAMADDSTRIIPGHGPLSSKAELKEYVEMLTGIRDRVRKLVEEGKTLEEAQAAKPTGAFDKKWGNDFMTPPKFTELVYKDLARFVD